MEETLKPCPFCGAEAEIVRNGSGSYFVRCTNKQCAAKTRLYHENENGARLAWNRRAGIACEQRRTRRTCRDVGGLSKFVCSECGASLDMEGRWDEPTYWVDEVAAALEYCPNCGAKVVDE